MRAIEVDSSGKLTLTEAPEPVPRDGEMIVRVNAISVNRGEVLRARAAGAGFRPGWDFAGVVLSSTAGGPAEGTKVAGYLKAGAWAERVAVAPAFVAEVPEGVELQTAASLPVAGLTALGALDLGGGLLGRRVLVTGASGGVGSIAANLGALAGAEVTAVVRRPAGECRHLFRGGVEVLSMRGGLREAERCGKFDLVIETLGGRTLGEVLAMLTPAGKCVTLGVTDSPTATFDAERFFMTGNASLEGFVLFRDRRSLPAEGLQRLFRLVAKGDLVLPVGMVGEWEEAERIADQLLARSFVGKAVLSVRGLDASG